MEDILVLILVSVEVKTTETTLVSVLIHHALFLLVKTTYAKPLDKQEPGKEELFCQAVM
jgi:hypothetical protein